MINTYKLEEVEGFIVARVYADGKKTSAYTHKIPKELEEEFLNMPF